MPLLPEIPGFYYDNDKKKYFKVAPTHVNNSNKYNVDRVKQEREAAEEARAKAQEEEDVKPLLKRRRRVSVGSNGIQNYRLRVEMGLSKTEAPQDDGEAAIWARTLQAEHVLRASRDKQISGLEVLPGLDGIFTFAPSQCLRWYPRPYDHFYEKRQKVSDTVLLPDMQNRMTSSAVSPSGKSIIVACSSSLAAISIKKYGEPNIDQTLKFPQAGTIWSCATNSAGTIAVGGSCKTGQNGLLALNPTDPASKLIIRPESDVLALEYLDDNVLLTGSRNGKIHIYDSRKNLEKDVSHEAASASHISCITHMHKLRNDHHILVNGLGGQTILHDLRYCRPLPSYQRGTRKGASNPVLTYSNGNKLTIGLGFDVSVDQDIMAVAGEDNHVRLYSVSTGRLLRELAQKDEVSGLRFSTDPIDGCADLFVATGPAVYRYHTGEPGEDLW